jgi:hypothetical protein
MEGFYAAEDKSTPFMVSFSVFIFTSKKVIKKAQVISFSKNHLGYPLFNPLSPKRFLVLLTGDTNINY